MPAAPWKTGIKIHFSDIFLYTSKISLINYVCYRDEHNYWIINRPLYRRRLFEGVRVRRGGDLCVWLSLRPPHLPQRHLSLPRSLLRLKVTWLFFFIDLNVLLNRSFFPINSQYQSLSSLHVCPEIILLKIEALWIELRKRIKWYLINFIFQNSWGNISTIDHHI